MKPPPKFLRFDSADSPEDIAYAITRLLADDSAALTPEQRQSCETWLEQTQKETSK